MDNLEISGAVLCGGASKRMGRDKKDLIAGGKTFLKIQEEKLFRSGIDDVMISLRIGSTPARCEDSGSPSRIIFDEKADAGPLEGIRTCLTSAKHDRCFIISVDAVLVRPETIISLARLSEEKGSDITLLCEGERIEPLIGIYSKTVIGEIESCISSGKLAVREIFKSFPPALLKIPEDDPQVFNCNTEKDYRKLCELLNPKV